MHSLWTSFEHAPEATLCPSFLGAVWLKVFLFQSHLQILFSPYHLFTQTYKVPYSPLLPQTFPHWCFFHLMLLWSDLAWLRSEVRRWQIVLGRLFVIFKSRFQGLGDSAQWLSICLQCTGPGFDHQCCCQGWEPSENPNPNQNKPLEWQQCHKTRAAFCWNCTGSLVQCLISLA